MRGKGMSDNHSGMVALRSIDEHAVGWFRTCSTGDENKPGLFTVAGAVLAFHQTSHLLPMANQSGT